jgi:hypothetical protein
VLSLDRAWVSPRACLAGIRVHRSPLARLASDHLPLVATLDLAGAGATASAGGEQEPRVSPRAAPAQAAAGR